MIIMISLYHIVDKFCKHLELITCQEKTLFDESIYPFNNSLVLFGAGNLGKKTLNGLRQIGIEPLAFSDNNPTLWGKLIEGLQVLSPKDAALHYSENSAFIVTIWSPGLDHRYSKINQSLLDLGIKKVVPFIPLFWKYPEVFLPHYRLDSPHKIYEQRDAVLHAFSLWADESSRTEYLNQLKWLINPEVTSLPTTKAQEIYMPGDMFSTCRNEVFIDCGAFDGDTIKSFLAFNKGEFKSIIAFEPDPVNYKNLELYVSSLSHGIGKKIKIKQLAVGQKVGNARFYAKGEKTSSINSMGNFEIEVMPIDNILHDIEPTYIKMDIEGYEIDALAGACKIINKYTPVLAISNYHYQEHLWQIPLHIQSYFSQYNIYLRRYGDEFGDVVCYAVPLSRLLF